MEEVNKNQISEFKCSTHQNFNSIYASTQISNGFPLYCSLCILKDSFKNSLISIPQIVMNDNSLPIQNWPPGITQGSLDFLNNLSISKDKENIRKNIQLFYKELQASINQTLEESQQNSLNNLDKYKIETDDFIHYYNSNFKRNDLKNLFINQNKFQTEKYQLLLSEMEQTKSQDLQQLYQKINQFNEIDDQIRLEFSKEIKILTNKLISSINLLSFKLSNKSGNQQSTETINDQDFPKQNSSDQITTKVERYSDIEKSMQEKIKIVEDDMKKNQQKADEFISQLIQQSQLIKQNYQNKINNFLQHAQSQVLSSDIADMQESQNKVSKTHRYESIMKTIQQITNLDQQEVQDLISYSSQSDNNKLSTNYLQLLHTFLSKNQQENSQQNELGEIKMQISKVLQIVSPLPLTFIQSNFQESQQLMIKTINKQIEIVNHNKKKGSVHSEQILKPNKSYTLRFVFDSPFYQLFEIAIGLILDQSKDSYLNYTNCHLLQDRLYKGDTGSTKLVKGKHFYLSERKEEIQEIEVRVNINENIIQYSDYPYYSTIYTNSQNLDSSQKYRLVLYLSTYLKNVSISFQEESDTWNPII